MLVVSSSLQTGDPGLETGRFRLLKEDKNNNFIILKRNVKNSNF